MGTPAQLSASGVFQCQWATDGRSVLALDQQNRIVEFPVPATAAGPAEPVVRHDLRQLNVASWAPLAEGRFLVALRSTDEGDITDYGLVQGWMDEVDRILHRTK